MLHWHWMALLDCTITINESMGSIHTPEMKQQSKQYTKKGQPGPTKAKGYAIKS
jgi:hypothetical protein